MGMDTRSVAATATNDKSSRSHAVVQLALDMEDSLGQVGAKKITRPRRSRANLVDLRKCRSLRSKVCNAREHASVIFSAFACRLLAFVH